MYKKSFPTKESAEQWIENNNVVNATLSEGFSNRSDPKNRCKVVFVTLTHSEYIRLYKVIFGFS